MFFKKKSNPLDINISEILGLLSAIIATSGLFSPSHKNHALKLSVLAELDRLKDDHWDKNAFDRLATKIKDL